MKGEHDAVTHQPAGAAEAPSTGEEECVTHQPELLEQQKPLVEGDQEAATHQPELQEQQKPLVEGEQEAWVWQRADPFSQLRAVRGSCTEHINSTGHT